jgi:GNAT superfamily N-acetyltransferase
VSPTRKGSGVLRRLETRSEDRAEALLAPLGERQRERLVEALATADLLVRAATIELREVSPNDRLARQATAAYFAELDRRFPGGFDAVEQSVDDVAKLGPPQGAFVVATSDGEPVACGGVQALDDGSAEIKRMWVAHDWRGAGLGARLLRQLESIAVGLGHDVVRLDTNGTLTEAIAMYERAGYRRVHAYNVNPYAEVWFEKRLERLGPRGVLQRGTLPRDLT